MGCCPGASHSVDEKVVVDLPSNRDRTSSHDKIDKHGAGIAHKNSSGVEIMREKQRHIPTSTAEKSVAGAAASIP